MAMVIVGVAFRLFYYSKQVLCRRNGIHSFAKRFYARFFLSHLSYVFFSL
jgi:hypothetical protein